jgi:3-hydroxyisobutyrate dehydrogenase-like beta-hydroxyacid dehydrogenase
MGSAVGSALRERGHTVLWASAGRSAATAERAQDFEDVGDIAELCRRSEILFSICPPHAATDVAQLTRGFSGLYVDANAIAPETARAVRAVHERFVDGGIVGPPPLEPGSTRLYLSGSEAETIVELFSGTNVDARAISSEPGAASALKAAYAGWTKGSAALLLAMRELARREDVEEALLSEWALSIPELEERLAGAERSAERKGWRWIGEMEEISLAMADQDLPPGFHEAAAEIFRSWS